MINGKRVLAIVTARGGSKGLVGKNIKSLNGKPLIAWTIEPALKSKYIDKLIVSTDDEEIGGIAREFGAEVPFMRPRDLASDSAKSIDVVQHAIKFYQETGEMYDYVLLLQPTSPLRETEDIDNTVELLIAKDTQAVISVCETDHIPLFANTLPDDFSLRDFLRPEVMNMSRQEMPAFYRINGAIYLTSVEFLMSNNSFFGSDSYAYVMPKIRSIDIDDELDFVVAESILKRKLSIN